MDRVLGRTMSRAISLVNKMKQTTVTACAKHLYSVSLDLLQSFIIYCCIPQ